MKKQRMRIFSVLIFFILLMCALFLLITSMIDTFLYGTQIIIIRNYCLVGLFVFVAFIFRSIGFYGTPFTKSVAVRTKISGWLLFVFLAVPQWTIQFISDLQYEIDFGSLPDKVWYLFNYFDGTVIFSITIALITYCLGMWFDHGRAIQEENDEIL